MNKLNKTTILTQFEFILIDLKMKEQQATVEIDNLFDILYS